MHAFLEVVGPGNADSGSCLHLFLDGLRMQFGCGDGAQRASVETGVRPAKLGTVFLGSLRACDVGGLPGMLLTAADAGLAEIVVSGPPGLKALLDAAKPFFLRPSLKCIIREVSRQTVVYEDEYVSVSGVPLNDGIVAYITRFCDMPGKFDVSRAVELGVPRGRLYGVLKMGRSVTLEDGTEVTSEQVMKPATPGPVVLVVPNLTTEESYNALASSKYLASRALGCGEEGRLNVVVHYSSDSTLKKPRYKEWTESLGGTTKHVAIHEDFAPQRGVFMSNIEETCKLHKYVDAELFPLPVHATRILPTGVGSDLDPPSVKSTYPTAASALGNNWIRPEMCLRLALAPMKDAGELDETRIPDAKYPRSANTRATCVSAEESSWFSSSKVNVSSNLQLDESKSSITFLGTGSALPGKHRNVSGIHLNVGSRYGVLLDCGEGTYGQLWRLLGAEGVRKALTQLRLVFISHMHADHHLGCLRVLAERARIGSDIPCVAVVAPREFEPWLNTALKHDNATQTVQLFDSSQLTDPQTGAARFFTDSLGLEMGTVRVPHCSDSYALVMTEGTEKWKLVYSGDTRPCDALVEAGSNATLLIHEGTFEDRLIAEAKEKMHSTVGEALTIAERMGAWRTVLTHFSQRYPKVPALDDNTVLRCETVGATVAYDFLQVPFNRLADLPAVTGKVKEVFRQEVEELVLAASQGDKKTTTVT